MTSLLSRLVEILHLDLDVAVWSRMIGLILIGSIIMANMRNVLGSVSRVRCLSDDLMCARKTDSMMS